MPHVNFEGYVLDTQGNHAKEMNGKALLHPCKVRYNFHETWTIISCTPVPFSFPTRAAAALT
jgi:hypothetical protein